MSIWPIRTSEDPRMFRLWNEATGCYLHMSGRGETKAVGQSWLGYAHQAETLQHRAKVRGEAWPYVRRARNAHVEAETEGEA